MCKCDDCIKEFISEVCCRIGSYDPNNTDIFHGFNGGKEFALAVLIDTAKEFYGEVFTRDAIRICVKKRLEEIK